jgi:putative membrane protein
MVMMDWDGGMWGGGNLITILFSIAFLVAVIVGIVFVVRALPGGGTGGNERVPLRERETPEELVRRRFAAGEIDRDEYRQKLRDLGC